MFLARCVRVTGLSEMLQKLLAMVFASLGLPDAQLLIAVILKTAALPGLPDIWLNQISPLPIITPCQLLNRFALR